MGALSGSWDLPSDNLSVQYICGGGGGGGSVQFTVRTTQREECLLKSLCRAARGLHDDGLDYRRLSSPTLAGSQHVIRCVP